MWGDRTQNGSVVDLVSLTEVKTKNRSTYVYDERLLNLLRAEHVGSWNLLHGFGSMLHHTYRYNETVERIEERFSLFSLSQYSIVKTTSLGWVSPKRFAAHSEYLTSFPTTYVRVRCSLLVRVRKFDDKVCININKCGHGQCVDYLIY